MPLNLGIYDPPCMTLNHDQSKMEPCMKFSWQCPMFSNNILPIISPSYYFIKSHPIFLTSDDQDNQKMRKNKWHWKNIMYMKPCFRTISTAEQSGTHPVFTLVVNLEIQTIISLISFVTFLFKSWQLYSHTFGNLYHHILCNKNKYA